MTKRFSYTLLREWFEAEEDRERPELRGLKPHQKLLLLSDGSMTLDLELLYGSMVEVEVKYKGVSSITDEEADFLDENPEDSAMEREVWLTVNGKRLVYAHSLIPIACIEEGLKGELEKYSDEPLGRVLNSNKVFFSKERLQVGIVRCESAASDLGITPDIPFIARRYILFNKETPERWIIKAAVTEVFSPEIISSPYIKKLRA